MNGTADVSMNGVDFTKILADSFENVVVKTPSSVSPSQVLDLTADLAASQGPRAGTRWDRELDGRRHPRRAKCATPEPGLHFLPMQDTDAVWTSVAVATGG